MLEIVAMCETPFVVGMTLVEAGIAFAALLVTVPPLLISLVNRRVRVIAKKYLEDREDLGGHFSAREVTTDSISPDSDPPSKAYLCGLIVAVLLAATVLWEVAGAAFSERRTTQQTTKRAMAGFPRELREKVFGRVRDLIVEQLGVNPSAVLGNASFIDDLGADSLDTVEIVMALEEYFGLEIPDEEAEMLQTVDDVVDYVCARVPHCRLCATVEGLLPPRMPTD